MKALLVKTSSMGDLVHTLPAVTEALENVPGLALDWVVEEGFTAIASRHPGIRQVIPLALRRWRQRPFNSGAEVVNFCRQLRQTQYDLILDSQGLLKSVLIGKLARGPLHGFDAASARDSTAGYLYGNTHAVQKEMHAVARQKAIFAAAFGYEASDQVDFGLQTSAPVGRQLMFLHGTTWTSKEWPEGYWQSLVARSVAEGYEVLVPAGNQRELERAQGMTRAGGRLIHGRSLAELVDILAGCSGAVSVDTGLGHLASALHVPVVGIYGATSPALVGMLGDQSRSLASTDLPCSPCKKRVCRFPPPQTDPPNLSQPHPPCYEQVTPESVWQMLQAAMVKT